MTAEWPPMYVWCISRCWWMRDSSPAWSPRTSVTGCRYRYSTLFRTLPLYRTPSRWTSWRWVWSSWYRHVSVILLLSSCQSIYLCLFICLSVCLSIYLPLSLHVSQSVSVFLLIVSVQWVFDPTLSLISLCFLRTKVSHTYHEFICLVNTIKCKKLSILN